MIEILAHAESASWFRMAWPPLHPLLVNFTAALIPVSVLADLIGRLSRRPSLAAAGWWTIAIAAAVTPFTALAGWLWLRQMPQMDMAPMPLHRWLGVGLAVAIIPLAIWRGAAHRRAAQPGAAYLIAAVVLLLAVVVQGHVGATMSFGGGSPGADEGHAHSSEPAPGDAPSGAAGGRHEGGGHHDAGNGMPASQPAADAHGGHAHPPAGAGGE